MFDRYFEVSYYSTAPVDRIPEMTERLTDLLSRPFGYEWAVQNQGDIENLVTELYTASTIAGRRMADVINPENFSFNLVDRKALDQLNRIGVFWVSEGAQKHIVTDSVTRLARHSIENGLGLYEAGELFKRELSSVVAGKSDVYYRNLASTVMNRARNVARINTFHKLQITEAKILGIPDSRQCPRCAALDGSVYRVEHLIPSVERMINATTPEGVIAANPFINSIDDATNEFVLSTGQRVPLDATSEVLAQMGVYPPFHGLCRCQVVVQTYY
jgi:hypothetical protein